MLPHFHARSVDYALGYAVSQLSVDNREVRYRWRHVEDS
jgi:hypothetical protein